MLHCFLATLAYLCMWYILKTFETLEKDCVIAATSMPGPYPSFTYIMETSISFVDCGKEKPTETCNQFTFL